VSLVNSSLPNLNEETFHKEKVPLLPVLSCPVTRSQRCFWPPPSYHDTHPLPEAWFAMLLARERPSAPGPAKQRETNSTLQLEKAVLRLKYANFVRKVTCLPPPLTRRASRCSMISHSCQWTGL
jgi:hypothetical protein